MPKTNANACEQIADRVAAKGWLLAIRVLIGHPIPWVIYATRGDGYYHVIHSDDIAAAFAELNRIADESVA